MQQAHESDCTQLLSQDVCLPGLYLLSDCSSGTVPTHVQVNCCQGSGRVCAQNLSSPLCTSPLPRCPLYILGTLPGFWSLHPIRKADVYFLFCPLFCSYESQTRPLGWKGTSSQLLPFPTSFWRLNLSCRVSVFG